LKKISNIKGQWNIDFEHNGKVTTNTFDYLTILFAFLASKDCYIIWFSNIMIISEPDEGYHRNSQCVLLNCPKLRAIRTSL
jgi:hypothetical protein